MATQDTGPEGPAGRLHAPRAAAVAGILFSVLLITGLTLLARSIPADPMEGGAWLRARTEVVVLALNLVPFAGIAFLWFMGVLRDRLGDREDRFLATVFMGSGLLFLAMLFVSAAFLGGIILAYTAEYERLLGSSAFRIVRAIGYEAMHTYAIKMAAVFMFATGTLALRTRFVPVWIAIVGYAAASVLLLVSHRVDWTWVVFPLWVLLVSFYILIDNHRGSAPPPATEIADRKHGGA